MVPNIYDPPNSFHLSSSLAQGIPDSGAHSIHNVQMEKFVIVQAGNSSATRFTYDHLRMSGSWEHESEDININPS